MSCCLARPSRVETAISAPSASSNFHTVSVATIVSFTQHGSTVGNPLVDADHHAADGRKRHPFRVREGVAAGPAAEKRTLDFSPFTRSRGLAATRSSWIPCRGIRRASTCCGLGLLPLLAWRGRRDAGPLARYHRQPAATIAAHRDHGPPPGSLGNHLPA